MKIAVISTTIMVLPPTGYSGLELLAWQQAEGLKAKGHKVTLISPHGSKTSCDHHGTTLGESEQQAYSGYVQKLPEFDVIIDHSWNKWSYALKAEGKLNIPILAVAHAPINTMFNSKPPVDKPCLVAISQDQANHIKEHLKCDARVAYNGINIDDYKPTGKPRNNRYLFLARMSSIKGPDIAVSAAKNCKVSLDVVGDDKLTGEPDLTKLVKDTCSLTPGLRYIGNQSRTDCAKWFNSNKCLLHANERFREPFGLAPIESQACGMPVIAWKHGAMMETISNGNTGFLVSSQAEMEELIKTDAVSVIKSEWCREWASQFSVDAMINRYEQLCHEAIQTGGW